MRFLIFIVTIFIACNNKKKDVMSDNKGLPNTIIKQNNLVDTTGFLSNCQRLYFGSSMGYLQGVRADKDSLGEFCFYECFDCKVTYEIIFVPKDSIKFKPVPANFVWDEFKNGCNNTFMNFNCFAFVYPMRDPIKQKNVHDMNINFPVRIRAYEKTSYDNWIFLKEKIVKSFEELSSFQFRIIYHLGIS